MKWTNEMSHEASAEGWDIFNYPELPDIERDDDSDAFVGDPDAYEHIVARANEGSALHLQALRVVNALNPEHMDEIRRIVDIPPALMTKIRDAAYNWGEIAPTVLGLDPNDPKAGP